MRNFKDFLVNKVKQVVPLMAVFSLPCQGEVGIGECISEIYTVSLALVGIAAFVSIVYGGFMLLTAAGNASKSGEAMNRIKNAAFGIVLLFGSYVILKTINPDLVNFNFTLKRVEFEEEVATLNLSSRIEDFEVYPRLASFSQNTVLNFNSGIFASSEGISQSCGANTDTILAKVLGIRSSFGTPNQVFQGSFSKQGFGLGKTIPWIFSKEIKVTGVTAADNSVNYLATLSCLVGSQEKELYRSASVTVNIAP